MWYLQFMSTHIPDQFRCPHEFFQGHRRTAPVEPKAILNIKSRHASVAPRDALSEATGPWSPSGRKYTTQRLDSACPLDTLRPRQNGRHLADDIFKCIFLNENIWIPIKISLKFVPKGRINNIPALVQIIAWRRPGDKPLSEPMMVSLLTHIYVTRPQLVNPPLTLTSRKWSQRHGPVYMNGIIWRIVNDVVSFYYIYYTSIGC